MEKEKKTKRRKKKREEGSFQKRRLSSSSPPTHSNTFHRRGRYSPRSHRQDEPRDARAPDAWCVFFFARSFHSLFLSFSLSLSLSLRVCSVLRWRRSVLSFFSRKPTTLKNQKNQSRNTNALVTKINQRRRLSLRLFVHDDIDAFPSR